MLDYRLKSKIFDILKFVLFVFLIPVLVAMTDSFLEELQSLPPGFKGAFLWGIVGYLLMHIFVCEPGGFYRYGQKLVCDIFRFFSPLVKVAPFMLPIYTILILILFYFEHLFLNSKTVEKTLLFSTSFTLMMHVVLTAKSLREKDNNAVKPNYFFSMALIMLINVYIVALLVDLILPGFAFSSFFRHSSVMTKDIYSSLWNQLF